MSTTPFYDGTVTYPGEQPDVSAPWNDWASRRFWIGKAAAMFELTNPHPASGYSSADNQGRAVDALYGGGQGVTVFDGVGRTWQYGWERLAPREWQLLAALGRARLPFGVGPYIFLPPEDTNRLTYAASVCGADTGTVDGWDAASGTLAYDAADAGPILGGGVMKWSGLSAASNLAPCADAATLVPDLDYGCPYIAAEPYTFGVWLKASTGSPVVKLELVGVQADGSSPVTVAGANVTLGGTWQLVTVTATPGDLGASAYVVPVIAYQSGGSALLASCPQLALTDTPVDWEQGTGAPRVNVTADLTPQIDQNFNRAATLALGEAFPGAA